MASSLGNSAYCGELTVNTLNYTTLNPAVSGFVTNPLSANLDGNNKDINNVNELTTGTLNYTALNPPINPGITNPLSANLDGNNKDITNVNEVGANQGTFTNTTAGATTATSVNCNSIVAGTSIQTAQLTTTGGTLIQGNMTNNGTFVQNALMTSARLNIYDVWSLSNFATFPVGNSKATPYNTAINPVPTIDLTNKIRGVIWTIGNANLDTFTIKIKTGINNVEENCSMLFSYQQGITSNPVVLDKRVAVVVGDLPATDILTFSLTIREGNTLTTPLRLNFYLIKDSI